MQTFKLSFAEWRNIGVAFLLQLALVVSLLALAIWLWPARLPYGPLSALTLEHVVRSLGSIAFLLVGITSLYLVVVEPLIWGYVELYRRGHHRHPTST
jgi:hypothetical protein